MTLDEARAEIEACFPPHPDIGNYYQAATGEPYVVIVNGGMAEEGERFPCYCTSESVAVRLWFDAINAYAKGKSLGWPLYWRVPPQIDSRVFRSENYDSLPDDLKRDIGETKVWVVYSRLLISDKPQIQPQALPSKAA